MLNASSLFAMRGMVKLGYVDRVIETLKRRQNEGCHRNI